MINLSEIIQDAQSELEGGKSAKIDWILASRQAMQALIRNVTPETTNKVVPIYGGLTNQLQIYDCPSDVKTPFRLYATDKSWIAQYVTPQDFYYRYNVQFVFTIEYVNGVRYIIARIPVNFGQVLIDDMQDVTNRTGIVLSPTEYNSLPFYQYGMEGIFSDVDYTTIKTLTMPAVLGNLSKGIIILPIYFDNASKVSSVKMVLTSSTGNYLTLTNVETLRDGQNYIRIPLANGVSTGSPDLNNILSITYLVQMKTGQTQNVVFGRVTVQKSVLFNFEYESTYLFVTSAGSWIETPTKSNDSVNINQDLRNIFHYELCKIAERKIKKNKDGTSGFEKELQLEYEAYFNRHPNKIQNITENVSPNLPAMMYPYNEYDDVYEDRLLVEDVPRTYNYGFIDNFELQSISGNVIDGTNTVFKLPKTPYPPSSIQLNRSGAFLAYGTDFLVNADTIIMTDPPPTIYSGLPFLVSYRYQI